MDKPIATPPIPRFSSLPPSPAPLKPSIFAPLLHNPIVSSLRDVYSSFAERRTALGLSNPGTVEGVSKEVQRDVFLTNLMFSGFRADLTKAFSSTPLFQTAHNFTMGAQGMSPYSFAALYGSPKVFFQGNLDNDFQLSARANYRWTSALVSKANIQLAPGGAAQSMIQLEADYNGSDYSINLKAMNPSMLEGPLTGVFVGDYLQSVTPNLSLGIEAMFQRASAAEGPQTVLAYAARYKGKDWIASGQLLAQGGVITSYWRKLSERVEAGADLNLQFLGLSGANAMMGPAENEGTATIGAKYDFRTAVFRGQVDSKGKVSCLLEKNVSEAVQVTFAGELDHPKVECRGRPVKHRPSLNWFRILQNLASPFRCSPPKMQSWNNPDGHQTTYRLHPSEHDFPVDRTWRRYSFHPMVF